MQRVPLTSAQDPLPIVAPGLLWKSLECFRFLFLIILLQMKANESNMKQNESKQKQNESKRSELQRGDYYCSPPKKPLYQKIGEADPPLILLHLKYPDCYNSTIL